MSLTAIIALILLFVFREAIVVVLFFAVILLLGLCIGIPVAIFALGYRFYHKVL